MTKEGSGFVGFVILISILLIVFFSVLAQLLPELETAGDALNQTNQCNNLGGCLFNETNSSTSPCRLEINQTFSCDVGTGDVPLNSLFSFSIIGLLVIAVALFAVIGAFAKSLRGQK